MNEIAECWIGNFPIGHRLDHINPNILSFFMPTDKKVLGDRNHVPIQMQHWIDEVKEGNFKIIYYSTPIYVVLEKLNFLGYTLNTARESFDISLKKDIERNSIIPNSEVRIFSKEEFDDHQSFLKFLGELNVDVWLAGLDKLKRMDLRTDNFTNENTPLLTEFIMSHAWYGYRGLDVFVLLRLLLEVFSDEEEFIYDITGLESSERIQAFEDLEYESDELHWMLDQSKDKIIILTEGRTDSLILKESIILLYPHLASFYSFMDFDLVKIEGGAGPLTNIVKGFAGAGILNKIIALFDNDTAVKAALKNLENIDLPPHIKIIKLPDLDFLNNYPTIGPTGYVPMNINGLAASIELYLGPDILINDDQSLSPIQWTGFEKGVKKYQGEVMDKREIHERFKHKLEMVKSGQISVEGNEWDGLRAVFNSIFSAYHDIQRKLILEYAL